MSRRASASHGARTFSSGWLRALLGDPDQADDSRRLLRRLRAPGARHLHGSVRRQPGHDAESHAEPEHRPRRARASHGLSCCAKPNRLYNAPFPAVADLPDQDPAEPRRHHRSAFIPTSKSPRRAPGRWACSDPLRGTRPSKPATSARAASTSGRRSITTSATSSRTASSTNSSWRWRTSRRTIRPASPAALGSFAYFGPGTGTSPLPIFLAYLNGSRDVEQPGRVHRRHHHLDELDARRPARLDEPRSEQRRRDRKRRERRPTTFRPISTAI